MLKRERFEFALNNIKHSQWQEFEILASSFLASEYTNLRTLASPSGDGGRDSEIFSDSGSPVVVFQYSVTEHWERKIKATDRTLSDNFNNVSVLRYITNQSIGARADKLKSELLKSGRVLDICDQSWFLERMSTDANRSQAAKEFCDKIADPILADKGLIERQSTRLSSDELSVSLFYLDMQRADDAAGKNLTRSCFEALVKAALAGTSPDKALTRVEVYERVSSFLPRYEVEQIKRFIDNALNRLKKKEINSFLKTDSFCLNYQSTERIKDIASARLVEKSRFETELIENLSSSVVFRGKEIEVYVDVIFKVIDQYFLKQGERFASAIVRGEISETPISAVEEAIDSYLHTDGANQSIDASAISGAVQDVLSDPSPAARHYLLSRANPYTLLAFLSETPDVQIATNKLFSDGTLWLDTSALLPLIPEKTAKYGEKPFTELFLRARKAGISLKVTYGVIEELERHLNRCRAYSKSENWNGYIPYVYQRYVLLGGRRDSFSSWLENFMGGNRPEDDIADFIREYGIIVTDPENGSILPEELVSAIQEYWQEVHVKRRGNEDFNLQVNRLAQHDVENIISVLSDRKQEVGKEGVGFRSWWLTLDAAAYKMKNDENILNASRNFQPPVMSLDFLLKYLAFGPKRDVLFRNSTDSIRIFAPEIFDNIPADLMAVAEGVRLELADLDMHIIKRRVRDGLDEAKQRIGDAHRNNLDGLDKELDSFF